MTQPVQVELQSFPSAAKRVSDAGWTRQLVAGEWFAHGPLAKLRFPRGRGGCWAARVASKQFSAAGPATSPEERPRARACERRVPRGVCAACTLEQRSRPLLSLQRAKEGGRLVQRRRDVCGSRAACGRRARLQVVLRKHGQHVALEHVRRALGGQGARKSSAPVSECLHAAAAHLELRRHSPEQEEELQLVVQRNPARGACGPASS